MKELFRWSLTLAFSLLIKGCLSMDTACTVGSNMFNQTKCVEDIKVKMLDQDTFYFGNSWATRCAGVFNFALCSNSQPNAKSIATRIFKSTEPLKAIDRFVELRYESGGKNYSGCGNEYRTTETWSLSVDPLSDTIVYPWYVRHMPSVKWDHQSGDMFTMVVYDVGHSIVHGVYINIPGDDIANAEAVDTYHGPLTTSDINNPYIFLLYKQAGNLVLPDKWDKIFRPDPNSMSWGAPRWYFEDMATDMNLTGPVGVNFIVATGDEYAAKIMMDRQVVSMCPIYTARALRLENRPFIPSNLLLTVWIDYEFTNEMLHFNVCCKDYSYPQRNFLLNPLGNPIYPTAEVRSGLPLDISFRKLDLYAMSKNFTGKTYTLIGFDPDVPNAPVGTEERPLLHQMVTNIVDGDITTGHVGLDYSGPNPPDTVHTYYFFLYEQKTSLNATEIMLKYSGDNCYDSLVGRCLFDINRAVAENNLTLVGATWFRATLDSYVQKRRVDSGMAEGDVCNINPFVCETSGSNIITSSVFVVVVISLIGKNIL